jgi:hypothetical protein
MSTNASNILSNPSVTVSLYFNLPSLTHCLFCWIPSSHLSSHLCTMNPSIFNCLKTSAGCTGLAVINLAKKSLIWCEQITSGGRRVVVPRDGPADGNAPEQIHLVEDLGAELSSDVVEVAVDAVGRRRRQLLVEVLVLVVEELVEFQLVHQPLALLVRPGDSDHLAPLDFGDLADEASHRAGSSAHRHGLPSFGFAQFEEPEVGCVSKERSDVVGLVVECLPRHSQHSQRERLG